MGISAVNSASSAQGVQKNNKAGKNQDVGSIHNAKPKTPQRKEFREYDSSKETWQQYAQARTKFNVNQDLKSGQLEYHPPVKLLGDFIKIGGDTYTYHPVKGETYGDIKSRFNLPDGLLRSQIPGGTGGGNFDLHKAESPVILDEKVLENAMGEEIKH